jgi:hypothetical protein
MICVYHAKQFKILQSCHEQNEVSKTIDEQDEESSSKKNIKVQEDDEFIVDNEMSNKLNDEVNQMKKNF